jgi:hypothetical protein
MTGDRLPVSDAELAELLAQATGGRGKTTGLAKAGLNPVNPADYIPELNSCWGWSCPTEAESQSCPLIDT